MVGSEGHLAEYKDEEFGPFTERVKCDVKEQLALGDVKESLFGQLVESSLGANFPPKVDSSENENMEMQPEIKSWEASREISEVETTGNRKFREDIKLIIESITEEARATFSRHVYDDVELAMKFLVGELAYLKIHWALSFTSVLRIVRLLTPGNSEGWPKFKEDIGGLIRILDRWLWPIKNEPNGMDILRRDLKGVGDISKTHNVQNRDREIARTSKNNLRGDGPMFEDIGGLKDILHELINDILIPLRYPKMLQQLGTNPVSGILLHGPHGCGKSELARAIGNEAKVPFWEISANTVLSGISGESEESIRAIFSEAYRSSPSIVFIDEIDAIASKRDNLQTEIAKKNKFTKHTQVLNAHTRDMTATTRIDAIDPALRRPGRFDREFDLGIPDENGRTEILSLLSRNIRLEKGGCDFAKIARATPGFVGADLSALVNKAGNLAIRRLIGSKPSNKETNLEWWRRTLEAPDMEGLSISMSDFENAVEMIQPSLKREGFAAIPNVTKEFERYIISRIKHPEEFEEFGIDLDEGFLLYGPPGCGKTLIAKAVATQAGANFIHIKGPELLTKYVGVGERDVRKIFLRARACSPCILFFDEVDALTTKRGKDGGWVVEGVLTQLLIELDGADKRPGVFVIGATNRPEEIDEAIKRPGRLGKHMHVPLPGPRERGLILKAIARSKPISEDVDLIAIGLEKAYDNLSGADLAAVVSEAAMIALEEKRMAGEGCFKKKKWMIDKTHFDRAVKKIAPSVTSGGAVQMGNHGSYMYNFFPFLKYLCTSLGLVMVLCVYFGYTGNLDVYII
ncbi:hypothetical protein MKX03_009643 [Papaver bracteatum]|nr:hypothetical protein MKX03_009643 [Papaver bracteatum]